MPCFIKQLLDILYYISYCADGVMLNPRKETVTIISIILLVNVKVNFTLEQAMEAQRESRGIALLFL